MFKKNNPEWFKLKSQLQRDTIRLITCGSVDDGKSTLIGRMLFDSKAVHKDQMSTLKKDSNKSGIFRDSFDLSLLADGLSAEREQGITIDVGYLFFSTENRKFIIADTPGHEQYTRNMVTGASTADLAIILIDARRGVLPQTRRHTMICYKLGIQNIVIAVNKMDLVHYKQKIFEKIVDEFNKFTKEMTFDDKLAIPISALTGDNVTKLSCSTPWYKGPTLLSYMETVQPQKRKALYPLRFPVQWVNRPNSNFRGFAGNVASGTMKTGQLIQVQPSGETGHIKSINLYKNELTSAEAGQAVTITLDREIDISRGDVIVDAEFPCEIANQFEVNLVWMDKEPGYPGRNFWLKLGSTDVNAQILTIKHKINVNTFEELKADSLELNDLSVVTIKTDFPIAFETYKNCSPLGAFILINKITNQTIAAGMINYALRRSKNVIKQNFEVNKEARRRITQHSSKLLLFTGLSGSGKSTIANALEKELHEKNVLTYVLDGDNVRQGLNSDLGFSDKDRIENIRRAGEAAKLMVDAGVVVLMALIAPFRADREMVRGLFNNKEFIEIFVDTPLEIAENRDPKGLYRKARLGEIPNFTGISSPYETPNSPDIRINTEKYSVQETIEFLLKKLDFQ